MDRPRHGWSLGDGTVVGILLLIGCIFGVGVGSALAHYVGVLG